VTFLRKEFGKDKQDDDLERLRIETRDLALSSTYYFGTLLCGYKDFDPDLHGTMAAWIEDDTRPRRLGLAPRGHLKTSCWTLADSLRRATKDPHIRILLVNEIIGNTFKWIGVMQRIVESDQYGWLFPEVIPDFGAVRWNQNQMELKRSRPFPEPTIEGAGVGTASTSNHYERIGEDDLVGKEARESPTVMQKAIDQHMLSESLVVHPGCPISTVGTRWGARDLADWMLKNEPELDYFCLSAFKPDGSPIWPTRFTQEKLQAIRRKYGAAFFSLQYLNESLGEGATEFSVDNVRYWHWAEESVEPNIVDRSIILERPEAEGGPIRVPIRKMTRWQIIDAGLSPSAASDRTANVVAGLTPPTTSRPFDIVILAAHARKTSPLQTMDNAWMLFRKWDPVVAAIEVFGGHLTFFYTIPQLFPQMRIRRLPTDTHKSKETRIREFYPFYEQRRVYVHRDHSDLLGEYETFPSGRYRDLLDAEAYLPKIWAPPPKDAGEFQISDWIDDGSETNVNSADRSPVTNY
jgi:hypothetical protein